MYVKTFSLEINIFVLFPLSPYGMTYFDVELKTALLIKDMQGTINLMGYDWGAMNRQTQILLYYIK